MNGFKRAWLHLVRKKGTSITLFLFLLIMTSLILTCLSIQSATEAVNANMRKALLGYFTVNAKQLDGGIDQDTWENILSIDGLSGKYSLRSYTYASYYDIGKNILEIDTEDSSGIPEGYENAGKIVANSNSKDDNYFKEVGFELIEGKTISSTNKNKALIHEDFAKRNHLEIGDAIILEAMSDEASEVEVIVSGIFTNTKEQESIGSIPSCDLYENIIFTDLTTASALMYGTKEKTSVEYGDFYVNDPEELERIIEDVQTISGIEWGKCVLTKYDNDYQNAKESLTGLQNIVFIAIVAVLFIGFAILSLFLILQMRGRIRETGIYLAMGFSKGTILAQYVLEVLIIAVFTLIISYGTSTLICNEIGQTLFSQVTAEKYETVDLAENELGQEEGIQNTDKNLGLSEIEILVSTEDYRIVWILTLGICLGSIIVASYSILRMKPKNLLSQMS